jgi:Protein of unknown function (DUF1579)
MTNVDERGSVASGIVGAAARGEETRALEVFIGNWINEGYLVEDGRPGGRIVTSDVYEWAPGGFFVVHSAYGRLAGADVGGIEIMGYHEGAKKYRSWFFDSQGNVLEDELLHPEPDVWVWQGEATRSTSIFSEGGKIQTTHHERHEGGTWIPSMEVVLTKVG